jgi:hypothetical protein
MRRVRLLSKSFISSSFFIISSAALYAASFLYENWWPCSFFSLIPLFVQRFHSYYEAAFKGFLWGVVAYGLTLSALLEVIIRLGPKPFSFVYAGGFLGYFVLFSMVWFVCVFFLKRCTTPWQWAWFWGTVIYFSWVHVGFFYFLVGRWYGYGLACPLVPLIKTPFFLGLLPYITWLGLLGSLLLWQVGIAYKSWKKSVIGLIPFLVGPFIFKGKTQDEKLQERLVIVAQSFQASTPYERAQEVCEVLRRAQRLHPFALVFILPESTFPFPLNKYRYVQEMWAEVVPHKYLIVGSHFCEAPKKGKERLYNSVYVLHKGHLIYRYDKRRLLPFFEEPSVWGERNSLFLENKGAFDAGVTFQPACTFPLIGTFSFCVCSELLWDMPAKKQVIALVHDGHYRFSYFPRLFRDFAYFQALEKQSTLFYCGWKKKSIDIT